MNLFAKIFLGFWVSTAAIIASWLLAAHYFNPFDDSIGSAWQTQVELDQAMRPSHAARQPPGFPPGDRRTRLSPGLRELGPGSRNIFQIFYGLQNVSADELKDWIIEREKADNIDIRLVDDTGREIFNRKLVVGSEDILQRLAGFRNRVLHREGDVMLFGQELYRPEWGRLQLIIATHPPTSPVIKFLTEHLWLRLLLALLISGAISYAVSRYLTRPLKNLREASRELAEGNLAARIDVPDRGGDETVELARDFNSMAAQLQQKIQSQKRLLSDVSHELRSPLARVRVALALAEREPSRSTEQLQRIEKETERLDGLIGQLLNTPDTMSDMEDSLDLVALLRQVCEDAEFEAREKDKTVGFRSTLTEVVVRTHGDLLKRALENVIRNAVRYTPTDTEVSVVLQQDNNGLHIIVEDQGPGVPEDDLEKIFEPFYRIDEARQRETGGFGLGLSIARRAIEQHNGTITANNSEKGSGCGGLRVTIRLPLP